MQYQETELQTQLLTRENARLNDLVNQIRSTSEAVDILNFGLAQQ